MWVSVYVCEQEGNYIFKVSNGGNIDLQTAQNIFLRGYTTKQGSHSGMGLYIVAQLVQKYGGKMLQRKDGVLEFIVTLPKSKLGREIDALSGSKVSPKTYGEFKTSS